MDSNASGYLLNHAALYCQGKEEANIIDLGLSLRTLQPAACYSCDNDNYEVLVDWQELHPQLKTKAKNVYSLSTKESFNEEADGIQRRVHWAYVKVHMDRVIVGRKICILHNMDYLNLALRLEDMFGKHSMNGLRLFHEESEFCLFYKDKDEHWRIVGDVPWKEFVDRVKRLRIARKDEP